VLCREVIETIRRILLTGALVLVRQNSTMQIAVGILLSLIFVKLYAYFQPFEKDKMNFLSEVAQYQVCFVFFIFLLLRDDGFRSNNEMLCDVCLVLASIALVLADLMYAFISFIDGGESERFKDRVSPL
jgi:hypothetical protein